ncbi:MAG: DegT/DnrJ/EryC1/StrS aminotransferase [Coprococcus sp.]|nr:DegT/DnrJ/EryC1/StrS aminotransferase [Coprococcus sp.]
MENLKSIVTTEPLLDHENGFFKRLCQTDGELSFTMSGRCGIYQCLEDIKQKDQKRVAYLPMYTCETVAAPFQKAGYTLRFYEVDENLRSIFDDAVINEISVLSLCGYYGFCNYDHEFVKECHERGVVIFEDMTHSLLCRDGMVPLCDYAAGSFRKWMDVASDGFAMKRRGKFEIGCQKPHQEHLALRRQYIDTHSMDAFWDAEMMLRQIFDLYAVPKTLKGLRPVFPALTENAVPSHFCFYAEEREHFLAYLKEHNIFYKVFWPVGPLVNVEGHDTVKYVYGHIVSLFCDQHCGREYMLKLARIIAEYPGVTV